MTNILLQVLKQMLVNHVLYQSTMIFCLLYKNITIPKSITSGTLTEVNEFTRLYAGVLTVS